LDRPRARRANTSRSRSLSRVRIVDRLPGGDRGEGEFVEIEGGQHQDPGRGAVGDDAAGGLLSLGAAVGLVAGALGLTVANSHGRGARVTTLGAVMLAVGSMAWVGYAMAFYSPYALFAKADTPEVAFDRDRSRLGGLSDAPRLARTVHRGRHAGHGGAVRGAPSRATCADLVGDRCRRVRRVW